MKRAIFLAPVALLVACSQSEPAPAPAEEAAPATEVPLAVDGKPAPGTYEITLANGFVETYVAAPDGTFTSTLDENEFKGTWTVEGDQWCSKEEGVEEPFCFTETIDENGVWTAVNNANSSDTSTIKRIE